MCRSLVKFPLRINPMQRPVKPVGQLSKGPKSTWEDEVDMNWGTEDFAAAAALLGGAAVALVLVFESGYGPLSRVLLGGTVVAITLAIWAHLAVGVF
jgi:hypothetical protein